MLDVRQIIVFFRIFQRIKHLINILHKKSKNSPWFFLVMINNNYPQQ